MVIYIPSMQHQPCNIINTESGDLVETRSFNVENWGGVYIHSDDRQHTSQSRSGHLGLQELQGPVNAFIEMIAGFLGRPPTGAGIEYEWCPKSGMSQWEVVYPNMIYAPR